MILNVSKICKSYLEKTVLKNVSFHLEDREKAAIVGINGSGKTSLLRIIMGLEESDSGEVAFSKDRKIGYLAQQHSDIETGLNDFDSLSGGQKTRKKLEEIMLEKPDLLILDEPTNHLDIESVTWLERMIKYYPGAVLLVSHDRYFLDRIISKVIDLENGEARVYKGNYTEYAGKKKLIRDSELKAYLKEMSYIEHQKAVIGKLKQFNREKSVKRAESREKALEKRELPEKPDEIDNEMKLTFRPKIESGNDVLKVKNLSKSYDKTLFKNVSFEIKRGEHVALIGANGTGKTTFLKILNALTEASGGEVILGTKVNIGYYDQEHAELNMDKSIFSEIQDDFPDLNNTKIRNLLALFLFKGDDVYKKIGALSGGERGRVSLAKLMLSDANFLILDEPTNHLDIQGKEVLEDALNSYEGTVLYVSHDRYFINMTAKRIIELYEEGFDNYIGDYDYYIEKKEAVRQLNGKHIQGSRNAVNPSGSRKAVDPSGSRKAVDPSGSDKDHKASVQEDGKENEWLQKKEEKRRIEKLSRDIEKTEKEIQDLEERNKEIEKSLEDPEVLKNQTLIGDLGLEHEKNSSKLEELYERWSELEEGLL